MRSNFSVVVVLLLSLVVAGGTWSAARGAPVTGAIFTTLSDGSAVNANHFDSKCAVYLDGGPGPNAPAKAAGLPAGDYYFQVTDPSGKTLLSTDPIQNRSFTVANGVIVAYTGTGGPTHPTAIDQDHSEIGAITIGLANASCPSDFLDTPNNGGTYKVWVTPVADFVADAAACGNGCFHGFVPFRSKTDNFKVTATSATFCLTIRKEIVQDDGSFAPGQNWEMLLTDRLGVTNTYHTDASGQVSVCSLTAGSYVVAETMPADGWDVFALVVNGVQAPFSEAAYAFSWTAGQAEPVVLFQNIYTPPPPPPE